MLNRAMCLARLGMREEAELLCDHITIVHAIRGRATAGRDPLWRRRAAAPEEKKARKPILSPEALKRGIVLCFTLAVCMTAWSFYSAYEAPIPPSIATMPARASACSAFRRTRAWEPLSCGTGASPRTRWAAPRARGNLSARRGAG